MLRYLISKKTEQSRRLIRLVKVTVAAETQHQHSATNNSEVLEVYNDQGQVPEATMTRKSFMKFSELV